MHCALHRPGSRQFVAEGLYRGPADVILFMAIRQMTLTVPCQAESEAYQTQGDRDANGEHVGGAPNSRLGALGVIQTNVPERQRWHHSSQAEITKWKLHGPARDYRPKLCTAL